jgi:hypothetical protein
MHVKSKLTRHGRSISKHASRSRRTKKVGGALSKPVSSPSTPSTPSLISRAVSIGTQFGQKVANAGLDKIAKIMQVDPNLPAQTAIADAASKAEHLEEALKSRQGKELLKEMGEIGEEVVENLETPLKKAQDIGNEFLLSETENLEKMGLDAVGMVPVVGEAIEAVRTGSDVVRAAEKAVDTGAKLTEVGADVAEDIKKEGDKVADVYGKMEHLGESVVPPQQLPVPQLPQAPSLAPLQKGGQRIIRRVASSTRRFMRGRRRRPRTRKRVRH